MFLNHVVNSMKATFLFAGLNLNTIVQETTTDNARFVDDALKTRSIKKFECCDSVLVCPLPHVNISGYAPASVKHIIVLVVVTLGPRFVFALWVFCQ